MKREILISALLLFCLRLFGLPLYAQTSSTLLQRAQEQAASGKKEEAIDTYRQVLNAEPNNITALSACANLLEARGRWREAVPLLSRLVEQRPNDADSLYRLGRMKSWIDGGLPEATQLLSRAADIAPNDPDYKVAYAEVLSRANPRSDEPVKILQAVIAAHPDHREARRLLARLLAQQHKTDDALRVLQPLLEQPAAQMEDYRAQAQIAEIAGNTREAAAAYRNILSLDPNDVSAIAKLAEMLSWSKSTRQQSAELFERGLKLDPNNASIAIPYAEQLSWSESTRARAMQLFDVVLQRDPGNLRALNGKAQLLAWSGHSEEALALYEKVLTKDPLNAEAMRGKAEILNWRGRYSQSRDLLAHAQELAPDDARTRLEMARAEIGLHRYADARSVLSTAQGVEGPEFSQVLVDVNRGLGTYVELDYIGRRNQQQLDFNRLEALFSLPIRSSSRLTFDYTPTLYSTDTGNFNSNHFGIGLDSAEGERFTTHVEFSANQYPGQPSEWNTAVGLHYQLSDSLVLQSGFERQPVEETMLSTRGLSFGGVFGGEVQSNLASVGASYSNSAHHYDASLTFAGGVYTGQNLDSNSRWGVDFNLGKSIRRSAPYLRISYGASYLSFDHDADFQSGQAPPPVTGGYYSPTKFLLNYGGLNATHKFGHKLEWDAAGTAGVQNAETAITQFSSAQFASTFATHAVWHVGAANDIRVGYDYLNVFNAFHRQLFLVGWRHYF
jgi:tetratricopeptide (TPR) repeat protein